MGATQQQPACVQIERLLELGQQPALAEPGLADDRERARLPLAAGGNECGTDDLELGFAADHLRVHALDATTRDPEGARLGALHQVAAQRLLDSLDLDQHRLAELEQAAHVPIGVVADAQPPRRCALLHARSDVDGRAADAAFGVDAAAQQHGAGVQAGAHREVGQAVAAPDLVRLRFRVFDDRQPGVHRALDVAFAGFLGAERGQHAVAGVLQHPAVVGPHGRGEALESAIHHGVDLLGLETLAHGRGADHVDEQHRHLLELLARRRPVRALLRQLTPQRSECRVDHGISERRPLRLRAQRWPRRVVQTGRSSLGG